MAYTTSDVATIQENLKVSGIPHYSVQLCTLGGAERASIIVKISLDDESTWVNGIYHNSRYSMFSIREDKVEQFVRNHQLPKFRKCSIKSTDEVVAKIQKWMNKV